jgi:hypothetical protein
MNHRSAVVGIALLLVATSSVAAQDWRPLPSERRCPARWGANDERGAANHMAPETVMRAVRLVKEGKVYVFLTTNGIFLLENMDLDALARDRVWEFAFILQPLKIKGGTGSTGAPIAVK